MGDQLLTTSKNHVVFGLCINHMLSGRNLEQIQCNTDDLREIQLFLDLDFALPFHLMRSSDM